MRSFFLFFTDPILRPSTIGSMLMCFSSALVGTVVYLRKKSLIGEVLSHAAFPGVILGIIVSSLFFGSEKSVILGTILGSAFFSFLALKIIEALEQKFRVHSDSALCFVLSAFFGLGILIASGLQQVQPLYYKQALIFLYGQAATMTSIHIWIYGFLSLLILFFILYFYRYLEVVNFDPIFAESLGIHSKKINLVMIFLIILAIVVGIRSVGVVLMAGMLISPSIAAKPLICRFSHHLILSAFFGILSGFLGNYLSVIVSQNHYSLPTGPAILIVSSLFCFLTLCFAPKNGLLSRYFRLKHFQLQCTIENGLKYLWKNPNLGENLPFFVRYILRYKGWMDQKNTLTPQGILKAEKIIRLHRLWEVYLVDYLGQKAEKVHRTAEELEHLLSADLEKELSELLDNPKHDPHDQPIPPSSFQELK